MMKDRIYKFTGMLFVIAICSNGFGQQNDTTRSTSSADADVVDLTGQAVRITIEAEKPRVNIIADRIKPEFDMMNLDRSYMRELTGVGEKILVIDSKAQIKDDKIDVKKIVNRSR